MGSHWITTTIVIIGHLYVVIMGLVGEEENGGGGELSKSESRGNGCGERGGCLKELGGGSERGVMTQIT